MLSLKQKTKLVGILKKVSKQDTSDIIILNEIIDSIEEIKKSIPQEVNLSPFYKNIDELKDSTFSSFKEINEKIIKVISNLTNQISTLDEKNKKIFSETIESFK